MINNGTIYLEDLQGYNKSRRQLGISTVNNGKKKSKPVLQVEVIPGPESKAQDLSFRWNVTGENAKTLELQLYFDYPLNVSSNPIPDSVRVSFNDPLMFTGMNGLKMETRVLQKVLPQQISSGRAQAAVLQALDSTANAAKTVVIGNFVMNALMSASLNQLWSMINTQQLIVVMPLLKISLPANAQSFFNQIFKIASFDIIDINPQINRLLCLNETKPFNSNFNALGFTSLYFLNNMNSILLVFNFYFLLVLLNFFVDRLQAKYKRLSPLAERLRHMLFYNFILSTLTESYSMIAICCMIGLNKISFQNYGEITQSTFCIFALLLLIGYPVLVTVILTKAWNSKNFNQNMQRYEPIFKHIKTSIGPISLIHPMYFLFRRLLIAVIVVFLKDHLIFQVMLIDFSVIAGVIIAGYIEYDSQSKRKTDFVNETMVMCVLYCMICFSPFVPDMRARVVVGYLCCLIVSIHLIVNLFLILSSQARALILRLKLWLARRSLLKQRTKNKVRLKSRKHTLKEAIVSRNNQPDFEHWIINTSYSESEQESSSEEACSDLEIIEEEASDLEEEAKDERVIEQAHVFNAHHDLEYLEQLVNDQLGSEELKIETKLPRTYHKEEHITHFAKFEKRKNRLLRKNRDQLETMDFNIKRQNKAEQKSLEALKGGWLELGFDDNFIASKKRPHKKSEHALLEETNRLEAILNQASHLRNDACRDFDPDEQSFSSSQPSRRNLKREQGNKEVRQSNNEDSLDEILRDIKRRTTQDILK